MPLGCYLARIQPLAGPLASAPSLGLRLPSDSCLLLPRALSCPTPRAPTLAPDPSAPRNPDVQLSKGLLQVAKALTFLHEDGKIVHGNLTPEAVFVNAKVRLPVP